MSVDLSIIVMILTASLGLIAAITAAKKNNNSNGREIGIILNDIDYTKRSIDEMRFEQRESSRRSEAKFDKINDIVIKHESDILNIKELSQKAYEHADNAHKRLNKNGGNEC